MYITSNILHHVSCFLQMLEFQNRIADEKKMKKNIEEATKQMKVNLEFAEEQYKYYAGFMIFWDKRRALIRNLLAQI